MISTAAILLFGKYPQTYYPRARVRFIRYEGTEEKLPIQEEKLPIEWVEKYLIGKDTSNVLFNSVIQLYEVNDFKQVFGRKEVLEILKYSYRNAEYTITKMIELGILDAVTGKGKGKYIFNKERFND